MSSHWPLFSKDSFKQKNSRVFYIPKKSRFRYFEKSNANILQTISCFKQVHKKWGFMLLCIGQSFCFGRISFEEITFHYIYSCSKRHLSSSQMSLFLHQRVSQDQMLILYFTFICLSFILLSHSGFTNIKSLWQQRKKKLKQN